MGKVLLGELHLCHNELVDEEMEWDIKKLYIISMRTPGIFNFKIFFAMIYLMSKMQTQF
jgi:hypothetical protein